MSILGIVVLLVVCGAGTASPSPEVTAELVCRTQNAIRWKEPAWSWLKCKDISLDFQVAGIGYGLDPALLFAIAVTESDLREKAMRDDGRGKDCGLMAVRCIPDEHGRCKNWPVRGLTPAKLLRPSTNIDSGAKILALMHKGNLRGYNGGRSGYHKQHEQKNHTSYPQKIGAVLAALSGRVTKVHGYRMKTLIGKVANANKEAAAVEEDRTMGAGVDASARLTAQAVRVHARSAEH